MQRDVSECLGIRIRVYRAVAINEHLIGKTHIEDRGDDAAVRLRFDDLKRRTDRVGGGVKRAGNEAVHLAEREHDGAEPNVILQEIRGIQLRQPFVTSHLNERLDVPRPHFRGIDNLDLIRQVDFQTLRDAQDFRAIP